MVLKTEILHKSRFFFHPKLQKETAKNSIYDILAEFGKLISKFNLIKTINQDTIVYRCRQHKMDDDVTNLSSIVAPPDEYAVTTNRFSPIGISMFYGASEIETAKMETLDYNDKNKDLFTIGKLKINRAISVLDLTKIPSIPFLYLTPKNTNLESLQIGDFIYDF